MNTGAGRMGTAGAQIASNNEVDRLILVLCNETPDNSLASGQ